MAGIGLPHVLLALPLVEHGARSHKPIAYRYDPLVAGDWTCARSCNKAFCSGYVSSFRSRPADGTYWV